MGDRDDDKDPEVGESSRDNNSELALGDCLNLPEEIKAPTGRDLLEIVRELESTDSRIGWAKSRPAFEKIVHGWFFESHVDVLKLLIDKENTKCIIELGSWLGRSAEYFARNAPNAVIFAVDLWDNSVILADRHYCRNPENLAILNVGPLHDRFMSNMWEYKYRITNGKVTGMLPMKMDAVEGLRLLKRAGVEPDIVYVDASHHYEGVYRDITTTIELFPNAHIVGDDYEYPDVNRAVIQCAKEHNLEIFESGNKCWTYSRKECLQKRNKRRLEDEEQSAPTASTRPMQKSKVDGRQSLKDLLKQYKK